MSSTLLRLGLWTLVLILGLWVVKTIYFESPIGELITDTMIAQAMTVVVLLIIAGIIAKMVEKGKRVVTKNRCRECSKPIPPGAIYCREHLRGVLELEDRRTHNTRIR